MKQQPHAVSTDKSVGGKVTGATEESPANWCMSARAVVLSVRLACDANR